MDEWPLLIPLTDEAREALGGRAHVEIDRLPFRIGRESRVAVVNGELLYMERRKGHTPPNNDLYLFDKGQLMNISREHLQIERERDGSFRIYDRGSACGTHVDGMSTGGMDKPGALVIKEGSEITIGTRTSPYRFTVRHLDRLQDPGATAPDPRR